MNKIQFVEDLSKRLNCTKIEAMKLVNEVFDCITNSVKEKGEVKFSGFGVFKLKHLKAGNVRIPSGEKIQVPNRKQIVFKSGSGLRSKINS